jgi:hypothetical protein
MCLRLQPIQDELLGGGNGDWELSLLTVYHFPQLEVTFGAALVGWGAGVMGMDGARIVVPWTGGRVPPGGLVVCQQVELCTDTISGKIETGNWQQVAVYFTRYLSRQ